MDNISNYLMNTFNEVLRLQTNVCERKFTSVVIPETVSNLGEYAFAGCQDLTTIIFTSKVDSIADTAFLNCPHLTDITVPWIEDEVAGAPWGAPSTANIHYKTNITATVEGVYTEYTQKRADEYISSDYVTVEFNAQISSQDLSSLSINIDVPSHYPYDSLVITNGVSGDDFEYVEVPLSTRADGSRYYYKTLTEDYTSTYNWDDIYGCSNEVADFIYDQLPREELNTNVASQLTFASGIITEGTGIGDMTCTVTLAGLPETTEPIKLVDTITGASVASNTGGLTTISETHTESNVGDMPPLFYIKDHPSMFNSSLLQFIATTFETDDFHAKSFSTTTQYKVNE